MKWKKWLYPWWVLWALLSFLEAFFHAPELTSSKKVLLFILLLISGYCLTWIFICMCVFIWRGIRFCIRRITY